MPNSFLHLLSLHPRYSFMKKNLIHFNQSTNPKVHGEGLVHRRKLHHLMGSGSSHHYTPQDGIIHAEVFPGFGKGKGMGHKHRRPAPLRFKL